MKLTKKDIVYGWYQWDVEEDKRVPATKPTILLSRLREVVKEFKHLPKEVGVKVLTFPLDRGSKQFVAWDDVLKRIDYLFGEVMENDVV